MTFLTDKLRRLTSSLQENALFNDIIFISAYNNDCIERPVSAPICSIGLQSSEIRSELYAYATFELKVYSSLSEGGKGCLDYLERISEYLLEALEGAYEASIGDVKYDSHTLAFTSSLLIKCNVNEVLESPVLPQEPVEVTINSKSFSAGYCRISEKTEYHRVNTMWQSEPVAVVPHRKSFEIETGEFEADVARTASGYPSFTLEFNGISYYGCRFTEIVYDMNGNYVTKALITAKGKQVSYG